MAYTTIDKPDDYFNTITWTGDGTTKDITGVGFQPDLVWAKKRSAASYHAWCDVVRGGTKTIFSNANIAEETSAVDWILSFASDGFGVNSAGNLNQSSATYVAWNWLANNTSGSSNTDGSITSTVSANTTSGFSIVSYSGNSIAGSTVGHGLGVAPKVIIEKTRTLSQNWRVYTSVLGSNKRLILDQTNASEDGGFMNSTDPTSSVFYLGSDDAYNASGQTHIAYCFAEKKGFSKIGSYTGNFNSNGPFIYTGFKPAFVIIKRTDTSGNGWRIFDNKRSTSGLNVIDKTLRPNTTDAEFSSNIDFVSNGIKIRNAQAEDNHPGTYFYMAFAENPFVTSTGIPACAR